MNLLVCIEETKKLTQLYNSYQLDRVHFSEVRAGGGIIQHGWMMAAATEHTPNAMFKLCLRL